MAGTIVSDTIQNGTGTSTSTTNVISGCAKAWGQFSVSGATVTINNSFNVSSITRNSTGYFTVNMTTAMPSINYSVTTQSVVQAGTQIGIAVPFTSGGGAVPTVTPTTSAFALCTMTVGTTVFDPTYASFAVLSS